MDFDAEHHPYEDDHRVAFDGDEPVEPQTQHQLSSDGAQNEIRNSYNHRDTSSGKLFVGGISWETSEESFTDYFSKYGEIIDSVIMMDKHTGRPRGFGFVTFSDSETADKVLEEDHVIDGRAVEVKRTVPRENAQIKGVTKTRKIFVGGIPPSFSEDELKEYFSTYGSVFEHQIMLDHKTGRSRGFGFVTFESEEAVDRIFSEGKTHELGGKLVEIKKAEPKKAGGEFISRAGRSYRGFGNGATRYAGGYNSVGGYGGKMDRGYDMYGGYGEYDGYSNYGGSYAGDPAGFYSGFGGYGYGFGFGGPVYGGAGYGGSVYGTPSGYGTSSDYSNGAGYAGRGYGSGSGSGSGSGVSARYGNDSKGYGNNKGYGSDSAVSGRYHPYGRRSNGWHRESS